MKKKGLIALGVICAVSFVTTVALGIASISSVAVNVENGTLERAWEEFAQRYHLSRYDLDYEQRLFSSVEQSGEDRQLDLSAITQGGQLEIECDNVQLNLQAGESNSAQLIGLPEGAQYRFELLKKKDEPNSYQIRLNLWGSTFWNRQDVTLNVSIPDQYFSTVSVENDNGSSTVSGVSVQRLEIECSNGQIQATDLRASRLELSADNGKIELSNPAQASTIHCEADNGIIRFRTGALENVSIQAQADNGRVQNHIDGTQSESYANYQYGFSSGAASVRLECDNGTIEISR